MMTWNWLARILLRGPSLGDVLEDRNNNFDTIRLTAAALVLYGHSYFEAPSDGEMDFVQRVLGESEYSGSVAVYVFFLISGMLITASMEKHRSALSFAVLRFARIWPGFAICTAVLLFFVVPVASGVAPRDPTWLKAASACWRQDLLFFFRDACGSLPRAFPGTPMPDAFGFSWWTLPAEVHCYAMVLALGVGLRSRLTETAAERWRFAFATLIVLVVFLSVTVHPPGENSRFHAEFVVMGGYSSYPVLFFFIGMILYCFRRVMVVNGWAAMALAVVALTLRQPNLLVYLGLAYGVVALTASRLLRRLKPHHDLSYGIYVYGAAMQQVVGTLLPGRSALVNFSVTLPLTSLVAYASWRCIEAPAIRLGRLIVRRRGDRIEGASGRS